MLCEPIALKPEEYSNVEHFKLKFTSVILKYVNCQPQNVCAVSAKRHQRNFVNIVNHELVDVALHQFSQTENIHFCSYLRVLVFTQFSFLLTIVLRRHSYLMV